MKIRTLVVFVLLALFFAVLFSIPRPTAGENKLRSFFPSEKEPKPEFPGKAAEYWAERLKTVNGESPAFLNLEVKQQIQEKKAKASATLPAFKIESYGPGNFGGRVRSILIHPNNPSRLLTAGVSGGVWFSEDAGQTWSPQSDFISNIAISSMALDPTNPDVVYLGTGEGFYNVDMARGYGIFKSLDFGKTWDHLGTTGTSDFYFVNRLAVIPGSGEVLAATRNGVYRSSDQGLSWSRVASGANDRGYVDLKVDPSNPDVILASHYSSSGSGSYLTRSEDRGLTFNKLGTTTGLPASNVGRMEIGWGADGVVYVAIANQTDETRGLWRSTDHGQNFSKTASNEAFIERQGWYDLMIGVDPTDSNRVYLGAVDIFRSLDAGATILKLTKWDPQGGEIGQYVHADMHTIAFHPSLPQTFLIGCDGGVYKSENGGDSFVSLNNDLRIAQNYGLAIHPDGSRVITGTQDNGSHLFFGDKDIWLGWYGGDGGFCAWDQQEPGYIYGSLPSGEMFGSKNMGSTAEPMVLPSTIGAVFITPFALDPANGDRMIVGTNRVFYSQDVRKLGQAVWTDASGIIGSVYALAFDPHNPETVYAANDTGALYKTTQLSSPNSFSSIKSFLGQVTSIWFDSFDTTGQTFYITLSSYRANRIMKTTNGGQDWESLHGDLPEIPVHALVNDPLVEGRLFAGTELGLFVGQMLGDSYHWEQYDYGLAWTRVTNLGWGDQHHLWAATHGRGTYLLSRNPIEVSSSNSQVEGDGDTFLDAKETHLVEVTLDNASPVDLGTVTVSLANHASGVTVSNSSQSVSVAAGASVKVDFSVQLDQVHSQPLDIQLAGTLQVEGMSHGFEVPLTLCANPNTLTGTFTYDAEKLEPMVSRIDLGADGWGIDSTHPHSGSGALFAAEDDFFSIKTVTGPQLQLGSGSSQMSFWLFYDLEGDETQRWDGMVLEAQIDDGAWFDLGNQATGAPYDGQLFINNALFLRQAWSAIKPQWRQASVDLSSYAGKNIRFRFRLGSDYGYANPNGGAWIDDIQVTGASWQGTPTADTQECSSCDISPTGLEFVYYLPYVSGINGTDSSFSIINAWSGTNVDIEVIGFDKNGNLRGMYAQVLPPDGALKNELSVLFPNSADMMDWIQIGASSPVEVVVDVINAETRSAYLASELLSDSLFVPHVAKQIEQFETHLVPVNGSEAAHELYFLDDQEVRFDITTSSDAWTQSHVLARDILGDQVTSTDWGKISASAPNVAAMEFFTNPGNSTRVAALGLNQESGTRLRFLHLAADTSLFWTGMVYFNSSNSTLNATEFYYSQGGEVLAEKLVSLEPGEKHVVLFDHHTLPETVPNGASWMEVNGDQAMVGYELFGSSSLSSNDYFAGLQGSYSEGNTIVFQTFLATDSAWTGLVLINVGDAPASLTLNAYDVNGNLLESSAMGEPIGPKVKTLYLSGNLFSEGTRSQTAWVKAVADGSQWDGFSLWGDHGSAIRKHLAGVRAAVRTQ